MGSVFFSDTELIGGLVSRDERVLKAYYQLYFKGIRRFIRSNNGNDEDARDIFHDALMVLFVKIKDEKFRLSCSPGTYLFSVSKYLWFKELRKRKKIVTVDPDSDAFADSSGDILEVNERNERKLFFRKCFDQLPEDCRKVLTLFTNGFSISEITGIMGYGSDKYTRNRRYRCKASLIEQIRAVFD
jgi:RNA polymerase sigma factor (sigma-70 family)